MAERSPEEIEAARKLFAGPCEFIAGAASLESLPASALPEVAFAGRSNVGKSSLVNALTGRRSLARTSSSLRPSSSVVSTPFSSRRLAIAVIHRS